MLSIGDGDTVRVRRNGKAISVRLAWIDACLSGDNEVGRPRGLTRDILGIPVGGPPRTTEPEQVRSMPRPSVPDATASSATSPAADDPDSADDEWGTGASDAPESSDSGLEPLTADEIATLHKFLGAMPQEARKRFTIEFRHHFQVPREVRTIKDRITQRRHKDFIDVFERELAGGTP